MNKILIILLVLFMCSCSKEELQTLKPESHITFSLEASTAQKLNKSRAGTPGIEQYNENRIDHIDVFLFDELGNCLLYPETSQVVQSGTEVSLALFSEQADIIKGKTLELYVLANSSLNRSALQGKTRKQLFETVQENANTFNSSVFTPQTNFLMDGSLNSVTIDTVNKQLGTLKLNRASAKIMVNIANAGINGYEPVNATISIHNYLDVTRLGNTGVEFIPTKQQLKNSTGRPIWIPGANLTEFDSTPFYSYEMSWDNDLSKMTYIIISVNWRRLSDNVVNLYHYRIPLDYEFDSGKKNQQIERNFIYDFTVNIDELGSLDPEEIIDLEANFQLLDWTTEDVKVKLMPHAYLLVKERDITIHNITTRQIDFLSSHPVSIEHLTAKYNLFLFSGEVLEAEHVKGDAAFPQCTVDNVNSTITVMSSVPKNYVPVTIEFRVKNDANLFQDVRIVQYPRQYVTFHKSEGTSGGYVNEENVNHPNGEGNRVNFNFYTISTSSVSPSDNYVLGDPTELVNGIHQTRTDEQSNRIISPTFVVASHRGITGLFLYEDAQRRCRTYHESEYSEGTWRMPTVAEMEIISIIQGDRESAIKNIFTGLSMDTSWWTAQKYYSMNMHTVKPVKLSATEKTYIRCVHDVWKDK